MKPVTFPNAPAWFLAAACLLAAAAPEARAQSGWLPTSWFSQGEVDSNAMYPLAEKDGPWLVMAATFRGDGARGDARRLVHELRGKHKNEDIRV